MAMNGEDGYSTGMSVSDPTSGLWRIFVRLYLWLSVAVCLTIAAMLSAVSESEGVKLVGAGFILFAGVAVAFARSLRQLTHPRWWHWALGTVLLAPAVLAVLVTAG